MAGVGRDRARPRTTQVSGPGDVVKDEPSLRWKLEEERVLWKALRLLQTYVCEMPVGHAGGR